MRIHYEHDDPGVRAMSRSDEMYKMLEACGKAGVEAAKAASPKGGSGKYAKSFFTAPVSVPYGRDHHHRAAVVVGNSAPHSVHVERNAHVLANAVASMRASARKAGT